jgi:hypothetical protein
MMRLFLRLFLHGSFGSPLAAAYAEAPRTVSRSEEQPGRDAAWRNGDADTTLLEESYMVVTVLCLGL